MPPRRYAERLRGNGHTNALTLLPTIVTSHHHLLAGRERMSDDNAGRHISEPLLAHARSATFDRDIVIRRLAREAHCSSSAHCPAHHTPHGPLAFSSTPPAILAYRPITARHELSSRHELAPCEACANNSRFGRLFTQPRPRSRHDI